MTVAIATGGCASEFDKQWKAAGERPREVNDLQGRWSGKWKAEGSGHSGGLKAVVLRGEGDSYKSLFHATYMGILSFDYTFKLNGQPKDGVLNFAGEEDIGAGGGRYTYEGSVTPDRFHCTFRTKDDHGTFDMTRPDAPPTKHLAGAPSESPERNNRSFRPILSCSQLMLRRLVEAKTELTYRPGVPHVEAMNNCDDADRRFFRRP